MNKQVNKEHYRFSSYVTKQRWSSLWHQLDEVMAVDPKSVLEIGPGPGIFKAAANQLNLNVETLDLDPGLLPDHVASADNMPFRDSHFDVVCAFQMLEHVPYTKSLAIFSEMTRVARKAVIISLPDAAKRWPASIYVPRIGMKWIHIPKPSIAPKAHKFDGQHYWEISKKGYSLKKVTQDFLNSTTFSLTKTYRVPELPYHRFLVFKPPV